MQLRPYQQKCHDIAFTEWEKGEDVLFVLATGTGKTIIFTSVIKTYLTEKNTKGRTCIAIHQSNLVEQAADKLIKVWKDADIGLVCDNLSKKKDASHSTTVSTIQSLLPYLKKNPNVYFDRLIIDEGHHVSDTDEDSQYNEAISMMLARNPNMRRMTVTATPYRKCGEKIYGKETSHHKKINYALTVKEAQDLGYLCGYNIILPVDIRDDLESIPLSASGEYQAGPLSSLMRQPRHIKTAVDVVKNKFQGRKRIVVYATDIEHANALAAEFAKEGFITRCVNSKTENNKKTFQDFEDGKINVLVGVDMLIEGWDCTAVDGLVLCAATNSLGRYLQTIGRGLRPDKANKLDCLIADLVGNCLKHGTPRNPVEPPEKGRKRKAPEIIVCPECFEVNEGNSKSCSNCGLNFEQNPGFGAIPKGPVQVGKGTPVEAKNLPMISWREDDNLTELIRDGMKVQVISADARLERTKNFQFYVLMTIRCLVDGAMISFPMSMDVEGNLSSWGKSRFEHIWSLWAVGEAPKTIKEFTERKGEMFIPAENNLQLNTNGNIAIQLPEKPKPEMQETVFASGAFPFKKKKKLVVTQEESQQMGM